VKFRFGICLVQPAIPQGGGEVERPYKMPCETVNANARKCSETLCVLCISVSRPVEQEKAFCRAKGFFFFPYFSFGRKSKRSSAWRKNGRDECRETLFTKDFSSVKT